MQTTGSVFSNAAGDDMQSVISETPSVFTGKITHAERNLSKMEGNRAKELEMVKRQLDDTLNELSSAKQKLQATTARKDVLENQVKDIKSQFASKMQILIQKTENDDKLITMLKEEIKRLEAVKNVKSTLSTGAKLRPENRADEVV
jgi:DNA repair ATPase RecN